MNRIAFALATLLSTAAAAQHIEMNLNPFGGRVEVRPPVGEVRATVTEDVSGDGYRLTYRTSDDGYTLFEVLEPEGARAAIWEGGSSVASDDVPMSFHARSNTWYRVVLTAPSGQVWERKLQARSGMRASLRVSPWARESTTKVIVVERHAPPPPAAPSLYAMSDSDFGRLKSAIESESFSKQKLDVLRTAARGAHFSVDQVGELVDLFDFGNDKVESVQIVAAKVVDRQNAFSLYERFTFSNDKEKVKAILSRY